MTRYAVIEMIGLVVGLVGFGLAIWALLELAFWFGVGVCGLALILAGVLLIIYANRNEVA